LGLNSLRNTRPDILALPYYANGSLGVQVGVTLGLQELLKVSQGIVAGLGRIHTCGFAFDLAVKYSLRRLRRPLPVTLVRAGEYRAEQSRPHHLQVGRAARSRLNVATVGPAFTSLSLAIPGGQWRILYECRKPLTSNATQRKIQRGRFPDGVFLPHVPPRI
jgi:hypothetical protein